MGGLAFTLILHSWNNSIPNSNMGFMILILCGTILFTWIYNNTDGSILAVMLLHTMNNLSFFVFPTLETTLGGLYLLVLNIIFVTAILIIWDLKH